MKRIYIILFCKLYDCAKSLSGDELYNWSATVFLTLCFSINIYAIVCYIEWFVLNDVYFDLKINHFLLIVSLPILIIMYFLNIRNDRYKLMYQVYEKDSIIKGWIGTLCILLYVILSFGIPFLLAYYWNIKHMNMNN